MAPISLQKCYIWGTAEPILLLFRDESAFSISKSWRKKIKYRSCVCELLCEHRETSGQTTHTHKYLQTYVFSAFSHKNSRHSEIFHFWNFSSWRQYQYFPSAHGVRNSCICLYLFPHCLHSHKWFCTVYLASPRKCHIQRRLFQPTDRHSITSQRCVG